MNFFSLTCRNFYQAIEDKGGCNTVRDREAKRHEEGGKEGWKRIFKVAPINIKEGLNHHDTDDNQGWSCCSIWHNSNEW